MDFIDDFADGGSLEDEVTLAPVYLNKRTPCDLDVEVKVAAIRTSENPKKKGEKFFVLELVVKDVREGQIDARPDVVLTHYIDMNRKRADDARTAAYRELCELTAQLIGSTAAKVVDSKGIIIRETYEDDAPTLQGKMFNIATSSAPNKSGYYRLVYTPLDAPKATKAKAKSK